MVGRSRFLLFLAGVIVAALCLPAAALAGTYSWDQPANFTTTPPGANPDHDSYGGRPWYYDEGLLASPGSFTALTSFDSPSCAAATWCDPTGSASIGVSSGQLVMTPSVTDVVAVGWTSPFASPQPVSVSLPSGTCTTTLVDQNGTTLPTTTTVPAKGTIYVVAQRSLPVTPCSTSGTLSIRAVVPAPTVVLTSPANGAVLSGEPTFSGEASTGFADSATVTVRVYAGTSATGTPVETLFTARSSVGFFSVGPSPALPPGQYTARAEQDDLAGDAGFSNATTFVIQSPSSGGGGLKPVKGPVKIGPRVRISKSGVVSVNVSCLAARTDVCTGWLLILTQKKFRPRSGGPLGHVRVLFAYVSVPGGRTQRIARPMPKDIAASLRRHRFLRLRFKSSLRT